MATLIGISRAVWRQRIGVVLILMALTGIVSHLVRDSGDSSWMRNMPRRNRVVRNSRRRVESINRYTTIVRREK